MMNDYAKAGLEYVKGMNVRVKLIPEGRTENILASKYAEVEVRKEIPSFQEIALVQNVEELEFVELWEAYLREIGRIERYLLGVFMLSKILIVTTHILTTPGNHIIIRGIKYRVESVDVLFIEKNDKPVNIELTFHLYRVNLEESPYLLTIDKTLN